MDLSESAAAETKDPRSRWLLHPLRQAHGIGWPGPWRCQGGAAEEAGRTSFRGGRGLGERRGYSSESSKRLKLVSGSQRLHR